MIQFAKDIKGFKTFILFKKFKEKCAVEVDTTKILQRGMLMTPESIHLNSFMYDPIIDMSVEHLKRLMTDVQRLEGRIVTVPD